MNPIEQFNNEKKENIKKLGETPEIQKLGLDFLVKTAPYKYSYHFSWMGRPIIAFPQDMIAMQELIWEIKPDLIIETGVAHGGSIIYYASLMKMMDIDGLVIGIDIDIRKHNRELIESHPVYKYIKLFEGSSIDEQLVNKVGEIAKTKKKILVCLDSNHTHEHVLRELELYAPFVSPGSYCVVFDTVVEDMPEDAFTDRPWGKGDNPKTAVWEFLKSNNQFVIDKEIENKLLITVVPDGFLKRVK